MKFDLPAGWRRLVREAGRLLAVLLVLELAVRLEPVKTALSDTLDPYENLLWYSDYMPAYRNQLRSGMHYDIWLTGSSYMMTGLQPEWVQNEIEANGIDGLTVQNYGMIDMRNLYDMAEVFDRWMFQMDKPEYMVIGLSVLNFSSSAQVPSTVQRSPMERTLIFGDSVDEGIAGWLYHSSDLYRYLLLARNATFVPRDEAMLEPRPLGGFIDGETPFDHCDPDSWRQPGQGESAYPPGAFAPIDRLIEVIQAHQIPVVVVDIPLQHCNLRRFFYSLESYQAAYLNKITEHLRAKKIPFLNMTELFYEAIATDEQYLYFMDHHHPNREGAKLFSQWTGEFVAEWLKQLPATDL